MRWAAGFVNGGAGGVFVTYEQIHPHDAFGQVTFGARPGRLDRHFHHGHQSHTNVVLNSISAGTHTLSHVFQVMMRNLVTRGCPLYSLPAYPDLSAQKTRCVPAFSRAQRCRRQQRHAGQAVRFVVVMEALQVPVCGMATRKRERPRRHIRE